MSSPILRIALLGGLLALGAAASEPPHESFEEDFQFAWREIGSTYTSVVGSRRSWGQVYNI